MFTINLQNTRFSEGDTFALPVTVKDYSRRFIVTSANYPAYELPIGRVTVLVSIRNKIICRKLIYDNTIEELSKKINNC